MCLGVRTKNATDKKVIGIVLLFSVFQTPVAAEAFDAEAVRASFLYHIARYVVYPENSLSGNDFNFCFVESQNKAHSQVFQLLPKKRIQDRDIRLVRLESAKQENLLQCQLLFVNRAAESKKLFEQLEKLNSTVVSVGETRSFIEKGGMITIVPLQSEMKIFFSRQQYENTSLKFSSLLLKRATFR